MDIKKSESSNTIQATWILLGSFSSLALALVSSAILSRYFDKAEYGTYRQILYVYTTLSVIFSAGLPRVFSYFLPRYNRKEGREIVNRITLILFLAGLLFTGFLFFAADLIADILNNPELSTGLKVFSPIPALMLPTLGIEGIFSSYKKTIYIAIYNTVTKSLTLAFIVLPVVIFKGSYISALYGWIVVSILSLGLALYMKRIPFKDVVPEKSGLSFKEIFNYSIPLVIASFWGIAIGAADQFYISRYFGTKSFAEFSNGFMELPFVGMVTIATSTVLMPVFSKMAHDKVSKSEIIKLWTSALSKSALIIYPLVVFFWFFAEEVMVFLYSDKYAVSSNYFQINIITNFFNIIIFAPLLLSLGKSKFYANVHMFLAILAWGGGFLVVYYLESPYAVAVYSVALKVFKILIFTYFISRFLEIQYVRLFPLKQLFLIMLQCLLIGVLVKLSSNMLPEINLLVEIIISFGIYGLLVLVTSKFLKLDYITVIRPLLNKVLKKYRK